MIKRYCWKLFVFFRIHARNDKPGRIRKQQYFEVVLKQLKVQRPRIFRDLKPKRIKDYLEYKFSQNSAALLKELNSSNEVNTVHVRNQKHELTPPRNRY
ncbi:hypothetical protein GQ457_04G019890 [Hibiscus cannabinus]